MKIRMVLRKTPAQAELGRGTLVRLCSPSGVLVDEKYEVSDLEQCGSVSDEDSDGAKENPAQAELGRGTLERLNDPCSRAFPNT